MSTLVAQPFQIGKRTENLIDSERNNRSVPTEIYYPAVSAGNNAPLAQGTFPLIVFGHGFVMSYSSYENISDFLVPKGYIIAFANTENGLSPSHANFGADLRFIARQLVENFNQVQGNFWFEKFNGKKAVMGHSMGGGASMLAASNNNTFDLVVGLAPAETNPSAVAAAASITAPLLIFAGSNDGVTPPVQHQLPIFNAATNSPCRKYISINGGGHCFFANSSFTCELGEGTSNPQPTINRQQQQSVLNDFSITMLETFLKNQSLNWQAFLDSLNTSTRITAQQVCGLNVLSIENPKAFEARLFPQPASMFLHVKTNQSPLAHLTVYDMKGNKRDVPLLDKDDRQSVLNLSSLSPGMYLLKVESKSGVTYRTRFIVAR
ncbi:MAG: T9SS type A sorting domain-containing protein [Flavobacteriales bacterium]